MQLAAGSRFGSFEIVAPLGAGGMGEVYRSRDARLQRDVALKILPAAVEGDPERLARFRREAQVLASLNHPNIAAIHGVEEADGRHALILELVEGPTLADRIAAGPLPIDEALAIARQIAEALEAAHEQGIVHRDLKPANIKLRHDGAVKVLDFGLAKALTRPDASGIVAMPDITTSPTMLPATTMTTAGLILGTAAYMAPEQARGKAVDRRADIWAFGCVLYEMLTGRRPFEGDEITDTLAAVLRAEPAWDALPAATPPSIVRLLRRCLQKNPRERLQAIGDARVELESLDRVADTPAAQTRPATHRREIALAIAAAVVTALVSAYVSQALKRPETRDITRALLAIDPFEQRPPLPGNDLRAPVGWPDRTAVALSPDGRALAFRGIGTEIRPGGGTQSAVYLRQFDRLAATPIVATTGANSPFFSPDGKWIGYFDAGELRRVPADGGSGASATTIAKTPEASRITGASWGDDDRIVFATNAGLWRVASAGGTPEQISPVGKEENRRILPHVLPGSRAILFTRQTEVFRWDNAQVMVRSLETGDEHVLLDDAADARYVASGHLVFARRGQLMAVPFDRERLQLTGDAVAVVDDVMQAVNMGNSVTDSGAAQFAVSANGTLVHVTGGVQRGEPTELVWVDRSGTPQPVGAPTGLFGAPRLSPDGTRILMFSGATQREDGNRVYVYDTVRRTHTAVTARNERAAWGLWAPDSSRIVFQQMFPGRSAMHVRAADGTGTSEPLTEVRDTVQTPSGWSRSGKLAFIESAAQGPAIRVLDMTAGDRSGTTVVQTDGDIGYPEFSPDGKWLAYMATVSGRPEVYVQPYPGPGARVLVSTGGGAAPTWKSDGRELYYYFSANGITTMYAVPIAVNGTTLAAGAPRKLFEGAFRGTGPARGYDVTPDGSRFLMTRSAGLPQMPTPQLVVVQNWVEELKRIAPAK